MRNSRIASFFSSDSERRPAAERSASDDHAVPAYAALRVEPIAEIGDAEIVLLDELPELALRHRRAAREAHVEVIVSLRGMRASIQRNSESTPSVRTTERASGK